MRITEILSESLNFEEGDCPIFAIALHRLSKLPLMALVEYDEEMGSTVLIHAYVKLDDRWRIDSTGETDVQWMLQAYPNNGNAEEVEISEKDLLELGYGKNQFPTLQEVLPHAKEVLANIEQAAEGTGSKQGVAEGFSNDMSTEDINEDILNEGATDILYFYRGFNGALGILNSDRFTFSSALGSIEEKWMPRGKPYFLSTTRTKLGDYHSWIGDSAAMFNLAGRWIGQRYTVKPIDYWEGIHRNIAVGRTRESEDRIYSSKPYMPLNPVTSLHLYYLYYNIFSRELTKDKPDSGLISRGVQLREIIGLAKEKNIPVYVYSSERAWRLQDIRKAHNIDYVLNQLNLLQNFRVEKSTYTPSTFLDLWVELITKDSMSDLSKDADKYRYNLQYRDNYDDITNHLVKDMNSGRKPDSPDFQNLVLINKYMLKNKLRTIKDLTNNLKVKWGEIYNRESGDNPSVE